MDKLIYGFAPVAIFALALLHVLFTSLLLRQISADDPSYRAIFAPSNPYLTQGRRIPALRLKLALPWVASPDLSRIGAAANLYLRLARITSVAAVAGAVLMASAGLLALLA